MLGRANDARVRWCVKHFGTLICAGAPTVLFLELVRGFELEQALRGTLADADITEKLRGDDGRRVHPAAIDRWARQIDEFAADMRRARLRHGDLKLKNILVVGFVSPAEPGDIRVIDFAYGETMAGKADDTTRLHAQLEWQCSEHEALVVSTLQGMVRFRRWHHREELTAQFAKHVRSGWRLLSHVYTILEDVGSREAFCANERIDPASVGQSEDEMFDFFFSYLIEHFLDVPDLVAGLLHDDVIA